MAFAVGSTYNLVIAVSESPSKGVLWRVDLRDDTNSPNQSISDDLSHVLFSIHLFEAESSLLSKIRMAVENQRKRVIGSQMPMQDVHLVIHQRVNSMQDVLNRKIVPGRINHHPSDFIIWHIYDSDGKISDVASLPSASLSEPFTLEQLCEGLQCPNKSCVCARANIGFSRACLQPVLLLLAGEAACQSCVIDSDDRCIVKPFGLVLEIAGEVYNVGGGAPKRLPLVVVDELPEVLLVRFL